MSSERQMIAKSQDEYVEDHRLLCQGLPFVLTDSAHPRLILKYNNDFLVMDGEAYIPACSTLGFGYYHGDTRHLSEWTVSLNDVALSLLSFDVEKGYAGSFLYTNPQTATIPQQKIMIKRQLLLSDVVAEKLVIENFLAEEIVVELSVRYQADFADMFEVRGFNLAERGTRMVPRSSANSSRLYLAYRGLDKCLVETVVEFKDRYPDAINDGTAMFRLTLPVRTPVEIETRIFTRIDGVSTFNVVESDFAALHSQADERYGLWKEGGASITTEHEILNRVIERGLRDLYILRQQTPEGTGIAAGLPWYATIFGRDSAIVGWQMLPFRPDLARECLELLAAYQGTCVDEYRAERPGKIMHELRSGELARLNKIPHTPYYGSVDATALWLMLMARYLDWTGDIDFVREHWHRIELALNWIDEASESGYITYKQESPDGLENQGWKDSGDSVCHINGAAARAPIALCEAQGYVYAALMAIADVSEKLGCDGAKLRDQASLLKGSFMRDFWMMPAQFPALALDGDGRQVKVTSSNAGHCLWTGIIEGPSAQLVADRLMGKEINSGWGLRTLACDTSYFNPISYHNGSIWPHDNAIIIEGLRKIGRIADAHKVMQDMVDVAQNQQDFRLPELICGFERTGWNKPINYPVSCSPQAWAAGSIFHTLSACLNFQPDAGNKILRIVEPQLPPWLGMLTVKGLKVGQAELDIAFETVNTNTFCRILRKSGQLRVVIES